MRVCEIAEQKNFVFETTLLIILYFPSQVTEKVFKVRDHLKISMNLNIFMQIN